MVRLSGIYMALLVLDCVNVVRNILLIPPQARAMNKETSVRGALGFGEMLIIFPTLCEISLMPKCVPLEIKDYGFFQSFALFSHNQRICKKLKHLGPLDTSVGK